MILKYLEGLGMMIPSMYDNIYELTAIKIPAATTSTSRNRAERILPPTRTSNVVSATVQNPHAKLSISKVKQVTKRAI